MPEFSGAAEACNTGQLKRFGNNNFYDFTIIQCFSFLCMKIAILRFCQNLCKFHVTWLSQIERLFLLSKVAYQRPAVVYLRAWPHRARRIDASRAESIVAPVHFNGGDQMESANWRMRMQSRSCFEKCKKKCERGGDFGVAGPYKGWEFVCINDNDNDNSSSNVTLSGHCAPLKQGSRNNLPPPDTPFSQTC